MIMVAELLITLFMLVGVVVAVPVIVCCVPQSRPLQAAAPPMRPLWTGVPYGQSWNSSGIRPAVHVLPGSAPVWPATWVGPARPAEGFRPQITAGCASAPGGVQIRQRRQLSGVGRDVIVHGVRR